MRLISKAVVVVAVAILGGCAPDLPPPAGPTELGLTPGVKADLVLVNKGERKLYLKKGGQTLKSYQIALGFQPVGHKEKRGDGRTPEGKYTLDWRNPRSKFYRSIHINYPNRSDRRRARSRGDHPGGAIMIHGVGWVKGGVTEEEIRSDWTDGCIAVSNAEMDEIWAHVADGTPIDIRP